MRTPSIVPHDAERDTYLVLDDFGGRLGCAWRETDAESADRATLIRDLLNVQCRSRQCPKTPEQDAADHGLQYCPQRRSLRARLQFDRVDPAQAMRARSTTM